MPLTAEPRTVAFTVDALPVAQPRPKATTIHGMTRMYEAKKSHPIHDFKASVRLAWRMANEDKLQGPLEARIVFLFAAKSGSRKSRLLRSWKATRPDTDNLAKGVLDTLIGFAFDDDGCVVRLVVEKWHAAEGEQPGVMIELKELTQENAK